MAWRPPSKQFCSMLFEDAKVPEHGESHAPSNSLVWWMCYLGMTRSCVEPFRSVHDADAALENSMRKSRQRTFAECRYRWAHGVSKFRAALAI